MTVANGAEIFNQEGIQLLELKKVLLINKDNPLIYKSLRDSIIKESYHSDVYDAFEDTVNENAFIKVLMSHEKYINKSAVEKKSEEFNKKISDALVRKGRKRFITKNSFTDDSVYIVKKFGISTATLMQEFRLSEASAIELITSKFGEEFSKYKLEALVKDMIKNISKHWYGKYTTEISKYGIEFELSEFYFDKKQMIYNIDFNIKVPLIHYQTGMPIPTFNDLILEISTTLELLDKEFAIANNSMKNIK